MSRFLGCVLKAHVLKKILGIDFGDCELVSGGRSRVNGLPPAAFTFGRHWVGDENSIASWFAPFRVA
jgi:hypothetical protein